VATGIPELEEPAQAKAALAGLWQARQFHEAAALAAKAMALWPDEAEFRAERAKSLLAAGALLEAEAAAREAAAREVEGRSSCCHSTLSRDRSKEKESPWLKRCARSVGQ
jgi:cytochrome c556